MTRRNFILHKNYPIYQKEQETPPDMQHPIEGKLFMLLGKHLRWDFRVISYLQLSCAHITIGSLAILQTNMHMLAYIIEFDYQKLRLDTYVLSIKLNHRKNKRDIFFLFLKSNSLQYATPIFFFNLFSIHIYILLHQSNLLPPVLVPRPTSLFNLCNLYAKLHVNKEVGLSLRTCLQEVYVTSALLHASRHIGAYIYIRALTTKTAI